MDILGKSLAHLGDFPYKDPQKRRFNKPVLFIRGTKSHYVADEALPAIGEFFPRFRLVDIDAGHWLISEQPEAFRQGEDTTRSAWHVPILILQTAVVEFLQEDIA